MAVAITFAQPLPDLALRKVLKAAESTAFELGLRSRHGLSAVEFNFPNDGKPPSAGNSPVQGQLFNSVFEPTEELPLPRIAEQLQVDAKSIVYRTWQYVSWSWQRERLRALILPALTVAHNVVSRSALRLEYLDRFSFDGATTDADPASLLRADCDLIARHVFSSRDQWHSHTGTFLPGADTGKHLLQINLDAVDLSQSHADGANLPTRWVNILTARENRFDLSEVDDAQGNDDLLFETLDQMHSALIEVFGALVTDEIAKKIFLGAPNV